MKKQTKKAGKPPRAVTLKHKDGRAVSFPSITAWAKRHHQSKTALSQVLNGGDVPKTNRIFCNGWYDATPLKKPIKLITDDNKIVTITNIGDFICAGHITGNSLFRLLSGKLPWAAGFRLPGTPKPIRKYKRPYFEYTFLSPKKKEIKTRNIHKLAKQLNISSNNLYSLGYGKVIAKGWKLVACKKLI